MHQQPRKPLLRDTYSPSTKRLLLEKTLSCRDPDDDQEETLSKMSHSRNGPRRDYGQLNRLRNTYSPSSFSSRFLAGKSKNEGTPQSWKSAARLTGFSPTSTRVPFDSTSPNTEYSKIQNKLSLLEERVNRAAKQLASKNSKKLLLGGSKLNVISQDSEVQHKGNSNELEVTVKLSKQKNISGKTGKLRTSIDMKKTLKIPELQNLISASPKPKEAVPFTTNPYSPRNHRIYYVSELVRAIRQENSLARQHVRGAIKVLKSFEQIELPQFSDRMLDLQLSEQHVNRKTVVFDLDETLIHCNEDSSAKSDVKLNILLSSGEHFEAGINIRPYALTLLNNLRKKCELILFTASHSCYANAVLDYLDPERKIFKHRLFRQHCYYSQLGIYVKDLRIINRRPENIVLVDNAAYSYAFQLDNGIPILSYYQGQDFQMKALQGYLEQLLEADDVRAVNRRTFKLQHYTKFDNPDDLVEQLYMNF